MKLEQVKLTSISAALPSDGWAASMPAALWDPSTAQVIADGLIVPDAAVAPIDEWGRVFVTLPFASTSAWLTWLSGATVDGLSAAQVAQAQALIDATLAGWGFTLRADP